MFGASADSVEKNDEFTKKNNYTYPLLCDPELKLIKALGILSGQFARRTTFVLDKEGKVAKIYDKVTPKGHAEEVVKFVKELAAKK